MNGSAQAGQAPRNGRRGAATWGAVGAAAVGLTLLFWLPLYQGDSFIGGDVYNYFWPLKKFYAEGLQQGELRLWHPRIGNGVPVLGESQTGALYPGHLAAYAFLEPVTAYNAVFLVHYVVAFGFFFGFARAAGLNRWAALLAAVVWVYGWFPPKACLEWSVVTGAWTPAILWATLEWLRTGDRRRGGALSATLALQLYAGHFQLAFVTLLAVGWLFVCWPTPGVDLKIQNRRRFAVLGWLALGFLLAGPQVASTWELKARSQRDERGFVKELGYGNVPPG
ncbi:MAG: hypothetical protein ACRC1K_27005, partial [Planctomycetia bacterium]